MPSSPASSLGAALPPPDRQGASAAVCVGIATRGRPDIVATTVGVLKAQTVAPGSILVSCTCAEDVGLLAGTAGVTVLVGPPGLPRQRNVVLEHLPPQAEVVVFLDDDFVCHPRWIETVLETFRAWPDVDGVTGHVVADGIMGPGLSFADAQARLAAMPDRLPAWTAENESPYGCNMAFRVSAIGSKRFDERLVLYGWLEDRDFGGQIARAGGRLVKLGAAAGVHLGVKTGRVSGRKFGYSQIANPIYINRKGTMTTRAMATQILRNVAANLRGCIAPEPFVDRRGRLWGNALAAMDLLRGRLSPERASSL